MNNGWVKLYRDIVHTKLWANPDKLRFYLLLLMKAGHAPSKVYGVDLKQGQFLTGRNALNSELNEGHRANSKHFVSSSTMYSWLKWLKANNLIDMQTTSEYTVITVFEAIDDSEVNNQLNNSSTTVQHQLNNSSTTVQHKQELKELREVKESKKKDIVGQKPDSPSPKNKILIKRIINYLNERTGKKFTTQNKNTNHMINARLEEGYEYKDFQRAIDNKTDEWLNNPKMNQYLRPNTLFAPTKFEAYVNQATHESEEHREQRLNYGFDGGLKDSDIPF